MAKRERKSNSESISTKTQKTLSPSEEAAARRAARRANRPNMGITSTRSSAPVRPQIVQSNRKKREILTQEQIAYQLAHPTKTVNYEELRREYAHVVRDIRNMFILAGALMLGMIILAQIL